MHNPLISAVASTFGTILKGYSTTKNGNKLNQQVCLAHRWRERAVKASRNLLEKGVLLEADGDIDWL